MPVSFFLFAEESKINCQENFPLKPFLILCNPFPSHRFILFLSFSFPFHFLPILSIHRFNSIHLLYCLLAPSLSIRCPYLYSFFFVQLPSLSSHCTSFILILQISFPFTSFTFHLPLSFAFVALSPFLSFGSASLFSFPFHSVLFHSILSPSLSSPCHSIVLHSTLLHSFHFRPLLLSSSVALHSTSFSFFSVSFLISIL